MTCDKYSNRHILPAARDIGHGNALRDVLWRKRSLLARRVRAHLVEREDREEEGDGHGDGDDDDGCLRDRAVELAQRSRVEGRRRWGLGLGRRRRLPRLGRRRRRAGVRRRRGVRGWPGRRRGGVPVSTARGSAERAGRRRGRGRGKGRAPYIKPRVFSFKDCIVPQLTTSGWSVPNKKI